MEEKTILLVLEKRQIQVPQQGAAFSSSRVCCFGDSVGLVSREHAVGPLLFARLVKN
jgi:hypothetical protein